MEKLPPISCTFEKVELNKTGTCILSFHVAEIDVIQVFNLMVRVNNHLAASVKTVPENGQNEVLVKIGRCNWGGDRGARHGDRVIRLEAKASSIEAPLQDFDALRENELILTVVDLDTTSSEPHTEEESELVATEEE